MCALHSTSDLPGTKRKTHDKKQAFHKQQQQQQHFLLVRVV
jgi:hypothetical protein